MIFIEMHTRRLASLVLGAWLGGSLLIMVVATHNFAGVDKALASPIPGAAKVVHDLGPEGARAFLRFQAGELNRWFFETWEWIEAGLGIGLLAVFQSRASASRAGTILAGLMLGAVVVMHLLLTPEIARLGSELAFAPSSGVTAIRERFGNYHLAYGILTILKLGLGMALAAVLLRRRGSSSGRRTRMRTVPADPAC
jgi:hypothetical protein